jgi:hypothetical protein
MGTNLENESSHPDRRAYQLALSALHNLPDNCAMDVTDLAGRIGADKLELIQWVRADIKFARLIASKVAKERL